MEEAQDNSVSIDHNSGYAGYVKVKVIKGSKVIKEFTHHNAGTVELFKYISNLVSGVESSTLEPGNRPGKLIVSATNSADDIKVVYSNIGDTEYSKSGSSNPYAQFALQFLIPNTLLSSGQTLKKFKLYSINGSRWYANIDLGNDAITITSSDITIIVSWVMGFTNK